MDPRFFTTKIDPLYGDFFTITAKNWKREKNTSLFGEPLSGEHCIQLCDGESNVRLLLEKWVDRSLGAPLPPSQGGLLSMIERGGEGYSPTIAVLCVHTHTHFAK